MVIVDTSAIIALIEQEDGWQIVEEHIVGAVISAVNLGELAQFNLRQNLDSDEIEKLVEALEIEIVPVEAEHAYEAAIIRHHSVEEGKKGSSLSQADCICLATAKLRGITALTADKNWDIVGKKLGISVQLIR